MRFAKLIAMLGLAAMSAALIYGFSAGDFLGEGARLLAMPWRIVSMVDLYVGFILFSGWIIYREKSLARSGLWVLLMLVLGFFAGALYALIALVTSGGDWQRFWMGRRTAWSAPRAG